MEREMNKVILVTRKTRLEDLIRKYNTAEQAKFYIEHLGADFSDYIREDEAYKKAVSAVMQAAKTYARVQRIDRDFLPNMIFGRQDIVIAVGQDGLVANILKYLDGQPLIGINPEPDRWDGGLLPFEAEDTERVLLQVLKGSGNVREITMALARTRDGQTMLAVNDLFVGQKTHVSARYDISWNDRQESQSSSGSIISTGLGSSGWYRSVMAQASGIAEYFGAPRFLSRGLAWEERALSFVVREPFPSRRTQAGIVYGRLSEQDTFRVVSQMPENGVVFSDGMESDAIEFNAGTEITVEVAPKRGVLAV